MIHWTERSACVGILYCGDLGAALAAQLRQHGWHVVTTCAGRSPRTSQRAELAGVNVVASLEEVLLRADVLISLVSPEAATEVAQQCAERRELMKHECLYLDANSIDLPSLHAVQALLERAGIRFVDAAIHGGAKRLSEMGVVYLSGPHATEAARLFEGVLRVVPLGGQPGQATRMKLLMAGQSKCLNMLFLEIAVLASRAGMLEPFLTESQTFYPEIMGAIERMLPTYPEHALRRVTELQSIEQFAQATAAPHGITHASAELLEAVAGVWSETPLSDLAVTTIIESAASGLSSEAKGEAP